MDTVHIAKALMKQWQAWPPRPDQEIGGLQEIFRHSLFLNGSDQDRKRIMFEASQSKYEDELAYPLDNYFSMDLAFFLQGKKVLDLGCLTGGRGVAWVERYNLKCLIGIDVQKEYVDAATQFAALKNVNAEFKVAKGEKLPFDDGTFSAILTFDVFEHVQDVAKTLEECHRVLEPKGRLFVVFPGYYHPLEHHLSLVTRLPGIHYLFSGKTLVRAYYEILEERGRDAYWYRRNSPDLYKWERGNTINGTTFAKFNRLIRKGNWNVLMHSRKPIGSIGRSIQQNRIAKFLSKIFYPLTSIQGLREVFLHRITFILEKRD